MTIDDFDITSALTWEDGLPRPQWDLIGSWIETRIPAEQHGDAWIDVGRRWMTQLAAELGRAYRVGESENILSLAAQSEAAMESLLGFAERCRSALSAVFAEVVDSDVPGKEFVLAFPSPDEYYRYVSAYYGEGEYGGSGGMQIREGYPHIALWGKSLPLVENTLAHELTHAALACLSLPQWIEEGFAQMFEHDMTGRALLVLNEEMAAAHKNHWRENGLDAFWRGEGFHQSGDMQKLSYELAEILIRLLLEEYRPRWFGWQKEPQRRLFAFLRGASADDCGADAAEKHLQTGLGGIASWFLGPGEWNPSL